MSKSLLLFGGTSGMGLAAAEVFAKDGINVVLTGRNKERAAAAVEKLSGLPGKVVSFVADVTKEEDIQNAVAYTVETFGGLDHMIYQPGDNKAAPIAMLSTEDWEYMLRLNLTGAFWAVKYSAAQMMEKGGSIVLLSSLNSMQPYKFYAGYCAIKAGLDALCKVAAIEYGPKVRINTINPGFVDTPLIAPFTNIPEAMEVVNKSVNTGRIGKPEDFANLAKFLCSDEAGFITGTNHLMDGGAHNAGYPDVLEIVMAKMAEAQAAQEQK